jgi:hypothetical protein
MARRRNTSYAPAAQITDNDLRVMSFLWQARCADTGNVANLGLYSTKNGSLAGVYKRLKRLEAAGFLRSYRLPMPVFEETTDRNGKITNRLGEDNRRIWLLRGKGIKELQKTTSEKYQSGTSVYNQAQRLAPQPSSFAHEVFALWAAQSLEARLTDDENLCRISASEHELRKQQAKAVGKRDFYDFAGAPGGSKVNPDWALELTSRAGEGKKLVLLEYDQGYYRRSDLRRKLDLVNGDDGYWNDMAEIYDSVELWLVGANSTVSARHKRWLKPYIDGEYNKLREVVRFRSLRDVMGGDDAYDAM